MNTICITKLDEPLLARLIRTCPEVTYLPNIEKQLLRLRLRKLEYKCLFTNPNNQNFMIDKELLEGTQITTICTASTGTNHIDMEYCKRQGIKVLSITKDLKLLEKISSTAEHAFTLMLSLIRNVPRSFDSVKEHKWDWQPFVGRQIDSLNIGVVGFGRLGKMMSKYCHAFGARVYVYDPYVEIDSGYFKCESLEQLLQLCDVVSLHVHVNEETKYMINKQVLNKANPFFLVNTSRGEIVKEEDVVESLESGKVIGYATDVIESEFDSIAESPLIQKMDDLNVIITPHIGGMTAEARNLAYSAAIDKLAGEIND
tara:strand:+ start:407 stop:1348 length:942 start_codon:yes stop_codon:yes gene_type:complete